MEFYMKDAEDEAFDELAKRQGDWGGFSPKMGGRRGGFKAKQAMAADKLHWSDCAVHNGPAYPAGECDCGAAQEPSACCHACFKASGAMLMTRIILCPSCGNKRCPKASNHRLECTDSNESGQAGSVYTAAQPAQEPVGYVYSEAGVKHGAIQRDLPNGTPLYAAPPKREWVGLTDEEREGVAQDYSLTGLGYQSPFKAIEAMLKEKNT
jgi:hypothetical protein